MGDELPSNAILQTAVLTPGTGIVRGELYDHNHILHCKESKKEHGGLGNKRQGDQGMDTIRFCGGLTNVLWLLGLTP